MILHIFGPSNSGKDTTAGFIQDWLNAQGIQSTNIKFSRGIKSCLEHLYKLEPFSLDYPEGKAKMVPGMSLTFLELLGLTWRDSQNSIFGQIWLSYAAQQIQEALDSGKWVILTDIRQPYEADLILSKPDWMSKYVGFEVSGRGSFIPADELAYDLYKKLDSNSNYWDYELVNNGTKDFLERQTRSAMGMLNKQIQIKG